MNTSNQPAPSKSCWRARRSHGIIPRPSPPGPIDTRLRIFRPRQKGHRAAGQAWVVLAWCQEVGLEDPPAAAAFLACQVLAWNERRIAEQFGRSRATVARWLPRGRSLVLAALEAERVDGSQLRELAERLEELQRRGA
jgi:hypothetical protein